MDGSQHFEEDHIKKDKQRDEYLHNQGLTVLRFDNLQVLQEIDAKIRLMPETGNAADETQVLGKKKELSTSLAAFHADLKHHGHDQRVVALTFSEFGRRVKENGSQGTDHGAAGPVFLTGGKVKAGVHGNCRPGRVPGDLDLLRARVALLVSDCNINFMFSVGKRA